MKSAYFINWMGNKFRQRRNLRLALPEHFDQIIEPFCGSAGFSRTLVHEGYLEPEQVWLNDTYAPLTAFYSVISKGLTNELVARVYDIKGNYGLGNRTMYKTHLERFNRKIPDMEKALSFFVVNRLCGGSFMLGDLFYSEPFGNGKKGLRDKPIENLRQAGLLMNGCNVTHGDYQKIKPQSESFFMLIDPPYPLGAKKEKRFYGAPFAYQRFATWCHRMKDTGNILITFDDNERHLSNFKRWNIYTHDVFFRGRDKAGWGKEMLIANYEIPGALEHGFEKVELSNRTTVSLAA